MITNLNMTASAGAASLSKLTSAPAMNGFECYDLLPFESEIFSSQTCAASKLTDEPRIQNEAPSRGGN